MPKRSAPDDLPTLLERARVSLRVTQSALGAALGVSDRTVARWEKGEVVPGAPVLRQLAVRLNPMDAALAADLARAGGTTPTALGLQVGALAAEAVVSAAADALSLPPKAVRPAVVAALARAKELGATLDGLLAALRPEPATPPRSADTLRPR